MSARSRLASAVFACALTVACTDLFHSTDFADETLCVKDPGNAACGGGADASVPETSVAEVDLCALGGDPAARAKRVCATLGACEGAIDSSRFGPCYVAARMAYDCAANPSMRPRGALASLWACLDKATTCDAVDTCVFGGPVPQCKAVPQGSSFTACAGGVRVQCASASGGRPTAVEPCALQGRSCQTLDSSRAACAGPPGCAIGADTCVGSNAVHCALVGADHLDLGVDCASYGAGACSGGACRPRDGAPSCSQGAGLTCNGRIAHVCVASHDVSIDCGKLGLDCDANASAANPWGACAITGDAGVCTDEDACNGASVQSCAGGALQTVDCTSAGLGACAVSGRVATCTKK